MNSVRIKISNNFCSEIIVELSLLQALSITMTSLVDEPCLFDLELEPNKRKHSAGFVTEVASALNFAYNLSR